MAFPSSVLHHMRLSDKMFIYQIDVLYKNQIFSLQGYGIFMLNCCTMFCLRRINYVSVWQLNNSSPVYGWRCACRSYKRSLLSVSRPTYISSLMELDTIEDRSHQSWHQHGPIFFISNTVSPMFCDFIWYLFSLSVITIKPSTNITFLFDTRVVIPLIFFRLKKPHSLSHSIIVP